MSFPCRIGQAFSPYGHVALPDGDSDRTARGATGSDGELDPPPVHTPCVRAGRRTGKGRRTCPCEHALTLGMLPGH